MKCSICEEKYIRGKMLFLNLNKNYYICENCIGKVINENKYKNIKNKRVRTIRIREDFVKTIKNKLKRYDFIIM